MLLLPQQALDEVHEDEIQQTGELEVLQPYPHDENFIIQGLILLIYSLHSISLQEQFV